MDLRYGDLLGREQDAVEGFLRLVTHPGVHGYTDFEHLKASCLEMHIGELAHSPECQPSLAVDVGLFAPVLVDADSPLLPGNSGEEGVWV